MMDFFTRSEFVEYLITKPLSHIRDNWDLEWNSSLNCYQDEDNSFAKDLNNLINELEHIPAPICYHYYEDQLAEYVKTQLFWPITKAGKHWIVDDYRSILNYGVFSKDGVAHLLQAISGRIKTAKKYGQLHFDDMEPGHQKILGFAMATILYIRA